MFRCSPLFLIVSASFASPAIAQEPVPDRNSLSLGVGASYGPSYEGSNDAKVGPVGVIRGQVEGFKFITRGPQLWIDLFRDEGNDTVTFDAGPIVGLRLNRTSQIKDMQVALLGKVSVAVEAGGYLGVSKRGIITSEYDVLSVQISAIHDVSSVHGSYVITPSIEYGTPLSTRSFVSLAASATIVGGGYARTYFGVTPLGSIASGLRRYDPEGGLKDASLTLIGAQSLSGDLRRGASLFGIGSYSKLLGDFKASPLVADVGSSNQWFAALGVGFSF